MVPLAYFYSSRIHKHTHTCLTALCPGLPRWASTRKVKPIWILLKQETVSGSGISWAICKSASRSRQISMPAPHHSVFYRQDALPDAQPTASKHWREKQQNGKLNSICTHHCQTMCNHKVWHNQKHLPVSNADYATCMYCTLLETKPLHRDHQSTHTVPSCLKQSTTNHEYTIEMLN